MVHVLYQQRSFCESNIRILTFRVKLHIFLFCANCTCKNEIYLLCFSRLLMTFTGKRSKEASKIEKKNSHELNSDTYQTYYMRKWLYTCWLFLTYMIVTKCISQNYEKYMYMYYYLQNLYLELVKYVCKICYSGTTIK